MIALRASGKLKSISKLELGEGKAIFSILESCSAEANKNQNVAAHRYLLLKMSIVKAEYETS